MMNFKPIFVGAVALLLGSCSNELDQAMTDDFGQSSNLQISVLNQPVSKAQVEGNYMPENAELAVFLKNTGGSNYDSKDFNNVKYTAVGTEGSQTWLMDNSKPISLTTTVGNAFAYYPYTSSSTNYTSIPISNNEKDWMYSTTAATNLSRANNTAQFTMAHAMTIIRCTIKKGHYVGTGSISSLSVKGNSLAKSATMNLRDATVENFSGKGTEISKSNIGTLGSSDIVVDLWAVPTGTASQLTFNLVVDNDSYRAVTTELNPVGGSVYSFTITMNSSEIKLSTVSVLDWKPYDKGNIVPEFQTLAGFMNAKFEGITTDGVYAVKSDGTPVASASASASTYAAVAIVMKGKAYQIAKADAKGYNDAAKVYWWKSNYQNIESLTDYTSADGNNSDGYLTTTNSPKLSTTPSDWSTGALCDFNGKKNTEYILDAQDNGTIDYTLAKAVIDFRGNNELKDGSADWFVPSAGELAYMFLKKSEIEAILAKIPGATNFNTSYYWSSTEYGQYYAWSLSFSSGYLYNTCSKYSTYYLRLIRLI